MTDQNTFAISELQQKANDGDAQAQFNLACLYVQCKVESEEQAAIWYWEQSLLWLKKAAEQGLVNGQLALGFYYLDVSSSFKNNLATKDNNNLATKDKFHITKLNNFLKGVGVTEYAPREFEDASWELAFLLSSFIKNADAKLAFEWFAKAAEQDCAEAQYWLAYCYFEGKGVEKNDERAVEWFIKAAEQGHAEAQDKLTNCYLEGKGVEQTDGLAFEWFKKAADQGYVEAQDKLARCYFEGKGVEQNDGLAFEWFNKAAEQDFAEAQFELASLYFQGRGVEQNDGLMFEWFKKAADQGHVEAQYWLADCYDYGKGVEQSDQNDGLAFEWYKKAAEQGHEKAKNWIAERYFSIGNAYYQRINGFEQNNELAFEWFTKAAELGSALAYIMLCKFYDSGRGVEQSDELAFDCAKKACELYENIEGASENKTIAYSCLATFYDQGKGVEKNEALAAQIRQRNVPDGFIIKAFLNYLTYIAEMPPTSGLVKEHMDVRLSMYISRKEFDSAEEFVEKVFENANDVEKSYKDICLTTIKQAKELEEKNQELEEKNKQLKLEIQRKESLQIRMQKLVEQFTHSLGNVIFPDTIYQVAERLKNNPECRKDVLLLHEAYHSEIIIKLQGDLLRQRHANTDPGEFRQFIRSCRRTSSSRDRIKSIEDILDYAASRVTARFLNQHYAGLTSIRDKILSKKNVSLDSLKQKFEDDILLNKSLCPIAWINQNLRPIQITEISTLWKKVFILSESHAEALLFGHFSEILFNAFKYADHDKDEFLTLVFDEKTINDSTYLFCNWGNPVKDKAPLLLGTGKGLDAIQEDLKQLNDTENPEESLLISQQKNQFQVTLFFKRDLLYKESTSEEDLNLFL